MITVRSYFTLRKIIGSREISVEPVSTVADLLSTLCERYAGLAEELMDGKKVRSTYRVLVNRRNITLLDSYSTRLQDGDEVILVPAIAGGIFS